jgi:hypothetical protein
MLMADGATRVRYRGVTERAADRRMIGVVEVQLLPPRNDLLSSGMKIGEVGAA